MTETPETLLQVAANLFAKNGFAGASMREISKKAGITQAAIYHHFDNKEALYFAVVRDLHEKNTGGLSDLFTSEPDPQRQLELLVTLMLDTLSADSNYHRIYFRELMEGDTDRLRELGNNLFAEMGSAVEDLMQTLAPHMDPHLMTLSLAGLLFHHLEARRLSPHLPSGNAKHTELPVLARHITTLLLRGVQPA